MLDFQILFSSKFMNAGSSCANPVQSVEGLRERADIYETEKITRKASDAAEYIELFGSFTRDHHARRI